MRSEHGSHNVGDPRNVLKLTLDVPQDNSIRPLQILWHKHSLYGSANLKNQFVASGYPQTEPFRNHAQRVAGGQPPQTNRHSLLHRNGVSQRRVLLRNHRVQLLANRFESHPSHSERFPELFFRKFSFVTLLPPRPRTLLHPNSPVTHRVTAGSADLASLSRIGLFHLAVVTIDHALFFFFFVFLFSIHEQDCSENTLQFSLLLRLTG
ncbi:hypothetical protein V8G54_006147 [Vigna mungo]|uniref:Uncharacterized protein n=1 Tax=Vigna mungo TaxID=3915 RepID=A0AAQ3NZF2_VIGMU